MTRVRIWSVEKESAWAPSPPTEEEGGAASFFVVKNLMFVTNSLFQILEVQNWILREIETRNGLVLDDRLQNRSKHWIRILMTNFLFNGVDNLVPRMTKMCKLRSFSQKLFVCAIVLTVGANVEPSRAKRRTLRRRQTSIEHFRSRVWAVEDDIITHKEVLCDVDTAIGNHAWTLNCVIDGQTETFLEDITQRFRV